jgi:hypothetical protein
LREEGSKIERCQATEFYRAFLKSNTRREGGRQRERVRNLGTYLFIILSVDELCTSHKNRKSGRTLCLAADSNKNF